MPSPCASAVTGADRVRWLNGLLTCELAKLEPGSGAYGLSVAVVANHLRQTNRNASAGLLVNLLMGWWSMFPPFFASAERPQVEKRGARVGSGSHYYRDDGTPIAPVQVTDSSGWNATFGMHRADLVGAHAALHAAAVPRTSEPRRTLTRS